MFLLCTFNRPNGVGNLTSLFSPAQLQVTSTGQVISAAECGGNGSLIYHDFTKQITAANVANLQAQRAASDGGTAFLAKLQANAGAVVGYRSPVRVQKGAETSGTERSRKSRGREASTSTAGVSEGKSIVPAVLPVVLTTTFDTIPGEGHCTLAISSTQVTSDGGNTPVANIKSLPLSPSSSTSLPPPPPPPSSSPSPAEAFYPQQKVVLLVGTVSSTQVALAKALNGAGYSTVSMAPCGW